MLVYGVVHLQSLPGSPSNRISLDEIIDLAQEDVNNLIFGGVDGIIIENFGDTPFVKDDISKIRDNERIEAIIAVSYTHLTLPTKRIV